MNMLINQRVSGPCREGAKPAYDQYVELPIHLFDTPVSRQELLTEMSLESLFYYVVVGDGISREVEILDE